jgi:glycogen debranching enzyme
MTVPNATEMSRMCYLFGGSPVGSVAAYYPPEYYDKDNSSITSERDQPEETIGEPPALFFDCTHDNEVPAQRRHPRDSLPNSALVAMVACTVGTTRGYDHLVSQQIDVVHENRYYPLGVHEGEPSGMVAARKVLNDLHSRMEANGYTEQHTHQDGDLIVIQRHNPITHEAVYGACRTSYAKDGFSYERTITVKVPGKITKYLGYFYLEVKTEIVKSQTSSKFIPGLESKLIEMHDPKELEKIFTTHVTHSGVDQYVEIRFKHFPPGSVLLFEVELPDEAAAAISKLSNIDDDFSIYECFEPLDATSFSYLFYSCENEELHISEGKRGCYDIPSFGKLPYAGIAGLASLLNTIRKYTDMGHPLFNNIRGGNWLLDYILERLEISRKYRNLAAWLKKYFDLVKRLPRHYIPKYFDKVLMKYFLCGTQYMIKKMGSFVSNNVDNFVKQLALTSFQFVNSITPLIDPKLALFGNKPIKTTMAAGLPFFSSGYMRVWGRDTFISLRGLLLIPGRFQEAREIIIGFASALRHGLIPNLLDAGRNPRYNSRDSVWWFLQSLQDYTKLAPEGNKILFEMVPCLFPWDTYQNSEVLSTHKKQLSTIVQEIMQLHAKGIDFRERNAGTAIDDKMKSDGFNIKIYTDPSTGFVHGGNEWNCGTWMDKMGESHRAGNHGVPSSPRDGADIEIIGLLKSTTRWLNHISRIKVFPHNGVTVRVNPHSPQEECFVTYKEWDSWIQDNFEKNFYIPLDPAEDSKYRINTKLVNRRGIYKDTVGSKSEWADYQLRPNICVAMTVAPELFNKAHARQCIDLIEKTLVGPLGMKTLDPTDWNYKPVYDNDADTDDYKTAKGFNYHQGPEWVWCFGFFLRAKILFHFPEDTEPIKIRNAVQQLIKQHRKHIKEDKWQGLPELTNDDGKECPFGCPTQAWSAACLMDALYDMYLLVKWEEEESRDKE